MGEIIKGERCSECGGPLKSEKIRIVGDGKYTRNVCTLCGHEEEEVKI